NGFSLIRRVFADEPLDRVVPALGTPLGDVLLAPHRSYLGILGPLLSANPPIIKALIHLTGGAFSENIPRVLPEGLRAVVRVGSWHVPALFALIQQRGQVGRDEMYRVFNMGIGMITVVAAGDIAKVQSKLGEESWVIGTLAPGPRAV